MFVIEKESIAGVGRSGLVEEQEELIPGRAALEEAEQQLQQPAKLQHTQIQATKKKPIKKQSVIRRHIRKRAEI